MRIPKAAISLTPATARCYSRRNYRDKHHPTEINPVLKKVLIALLLILNHSVMFGIMEAEEIPDEAHPYGQTFGHEHLHHHSHEHEHELHDASSLPMEAGHHDEHEPHHEHGVHIHLNMDVPQTISFDLQRQSGQALTSYPLPHQSQTYSPPVPPPNR